MTIFTFLFASQDATSSAASWLLQLTADRPEVLKKVRDEGKAIMGDRYGKYGGITIEDKNGNVIHLDSASDKLTMKVKGDASIESRGNLTLKAQGRVEISGTAGVKVDGGGATVDVKGSLINLN